MVVKGSVKRGEYFDSVTLMRIAQKVNAEAGVIDSGLIIASRENKAILKASGLFVAAFAAARDNDLLVVVKARSEEIAARALARVDGHLHESRQKASTQGGAARTPSLDAALDALPGANLVMISIAGCYAGGEARKALEKGLHVFLFSDNVTLATEIELKKLARDRRLLLMGPDCGTAIINGVPLGFANAVPPGAIGIVAAAGTGLQEVSSLIANAGAGISQAIGTGGRDLKKEVGGIMFASAIEALAADKKTAVMLLVAKPPDPTVREKIGRLLRRISKPVVIVFLGGQGGAVKGKNIYDAATLEEGAMMAIALWRGDAVENARQRLAGRDAGLEKRARAIADKLQPRQRYIRALYTGGTFCSEAQVIFRGRLPGLYSNVPLPGVAKLGSSLQSERHTFLDLGEDEFTAGRLHPMIDFSMRSRRMLQEAGDPQTALLLLDLVLGYGANRDPLPEIIPAVRACRKAAGGRSLPMIFSVTGTEHDPQKRSRVVAGLLENGAEVLESNAAAGRLALIVAELQGRRS
ncbi:MAG: acyl-CoA synthetase FdrA [Candidatus Aminicenantes bacterium]|nr:acyl-CoA synthetase FdrA [Candidatus Aminicenantes bacterium]